MTHKEEMELLTPEKAYERITARGEAMIAAFPRRIYATGVNYWVPWDANCTFAYVETINEGFQHKFVRSIDGATMLITKYSDNLDIK